MLLVLLGDQCLSYQSHLLFKVDHPFPIGLIQNGASNKSGGQISQPGSARHLRNKNF